MTLWFSATPVKKLCPDTMQGTAEKGGREHLNREKLLLPYRTFDHWASKPLDSTGKEALLTRRWIIQQDTKSWSSRKTSAYLYLHERRWSQNLDLDKETVRKYEFSIVSRALFAADGTVLHCSSKSSLMAVWWKLSTNRQEAGHQEVQTADSGDPATGKLVALIIDGVA